MKEHIEYLEKQVIIHEEELLRLRNALAILKGGPSSSVIYKDDNQGVDSGLEGKTLKEIILESLNDGIPKTKAGFLEAVRQYKGSNYKSESLSPHVSGLVGQLLEKEVFSNNPIATKYYYGKIEWFENGAMKSEYKNKIR